MNSRIRTGGLLWASSIQFFIAQVIVAIGWATPYSLITRYISDLGNTMCAAYPDGSSIYVCSPWHAVMNASFVVLGVTMATGAALIGRGDRSWVGWVRRAGLGLIAIAGFGVFLVGVFPENENIQLHTLGAGLNFVLGNLGMVVLGVTGLTGATRSGFDRISLGMGVLGLIGTALFVSDYYLSIGQGGMERVAAYPLTVWLILAGLATGIGKRGRDKHVRPGSAK